MFTHRVVLRRSRTGGTTVSCECRASEFKRARGKSSGEYYEPIGELQAGQSIWDLYNDPENHWVEFTDDDRVRV